MSDKWKLLRNYLRKDEHQEKAGKRTSFDLFPKGLPVKLASIATPTFSATQHVSEFAGFLNTGVAVACWETERVLAYYLQSVNVDGLRVLELGSGSVGLAGLILAATQTPRLVVLTDGSSQSKLLGNPQCITNIEEIIAINSFNCPVLASQLLWGSEDKVEEQSDMIIVSDCLYETDYHESLLNTLKAHLAPEGQMNPLRGNSFEIFHSLARKAFQVEIKEMFSDTVWKRHSEMLLEEDSTYNQDKEYPILSILKL